MFLKNVKRNILSLRVRVALLLLRLLLYNKVVSIPTLFSQCNQRIV